MSQNNVCLSETKIILACKYDLHAKTEKIVTWFDSFLKNHCVLCYKEYPKLFKNG